MKKKALNNPIEPKIAPQYGFRKLRPLKIPKMAWYALLLAFVMAVLLFAMYGLSFVGKSKADQTLLIYSDGTEIPEVSSEQSACFRF